jgi:NAD+ synthase
MAKSLILTIAQINPVVGDLQRNIDMIRRAWDSAPPNSDIIIFPELFLTGYLAEDLLLKPAFIDHVEQSVSLLVEESRYRTQAIIIGAPSRDKTDLYNSVHLIHNGKILATRSKRELPNYGVFDEKRYFTPGALPDPVEFRGTKLGVMVCEDMWHPEVSDHLKERGAELLIVINSSPYDVHKYQVRLQHAELRVQKTGLPLIYVNQTGSQGDLVFDGASFMLNQDGQLIMQCKEFVEEFQDITLEQSVPGRWMISTEDIHPLHSETESMYQASMTGLRDYVEKNGIPGVILGMSGGIDSALSAAIAVDALGADRVQCVMMHSPYTSDASKVDARDCAEHLGISYEEVPLEPLMKAFGSLNLGLSGLAHENLQSRLRGLILMTLSNQSGKIALSTGNKSEIAVGYSTLYGDTCGGYNCLKDIYKTQIYNLSTWRNSAKPVNALGPDGEVINQSILTKAPSAELRLNQKDQDSLPPYDELDQILVCFIEEDLEIEQIVERGHDPQIVEKVRRMLYRAEYKRNQSPPGPKISPRAFARERRYPLLNGYSGRPPRKDTQS